MKQSYLIFGMVLIMLSGCGTKKENSSERPITDTIQTQQAIVECYSAAEFGLIPGKIVRFAPTDDYISTWQCAGGDEPTGIIYVHIREENGTIRVLSCDYRAWLNLQVGDVLK